MILDEQTIILGTSDEKGLPNISPRSTFHLENDEIYWCEMFQHESYSNFTKNNWVSVAVFNKEELTGYQLKGKVDVIDNQEKINKIESIIRDRLTKQNKKQILSLLDTHQYLLIRFIPKIIYSLSPAYFSDVPKVLNAEIEIGRLAGGSNIESTFGIDEKSLSENK